MNELIKNSGFLKHKHTFSGYCDGLPYLYNKTDNEVVDGIGRMHVRLYAICDTCNKEVDVAMMHCNKDGSLYGDIKK